MARNIRYVYISLYGLLINHHTYPELRMTSNNSDVIAELPSIKTCSILSRDDLHSADYAVARCLSVCPFVHPSVCLSVTRRYFVETVIHILKLFSPSGSPHHLVFAHQTIGNIPMPPLTGVSNARDMKNCDFRPKSRFISVMVQHRAIDLLTIADQ